MKKVLGIVISERKSGNSELLVKEIMSQITEPCDLEMIRLTELRIEPCKACYRCLQPGVECRTEDDFNFLINKIKDADALIIGMPVYILGPPAYYKLITDRLLGAANYATYTRGKPCIIVNPYGLPRWEGYSRMASLILPRLLEMKIIDCWQVQAPLPGESLLNPKNMAYANSLGQNLLAAGMEYTKGIRECSHCGSDLFRLLPNGKIECPACSARGTLKPDNIPDMAETDYCRFWPKQLEEHFQVWLGETKQRFLREKDKLKEVQKAYKEKDWWIKPERAPKKD